MSGVFLTIPIDSEKKKQFIALAKQEGLTISALVRMLVDDFMAGNIEIGARNTRRQSETFPGPILHQEPLLENIQKNVEENFQKMLKV